MAEIVNLRQARKQKARAEKDVKAAGNRVAFGRSKAERKLTEAEKALALDRLEGHKRDEPNR
jgi:Domain of unknown function (DUF4169)